MLVINSRKKIYIILIFIVGIIVGTFLCGQITGYSVNKVNIYGNFVISTLKYDNISSINLFKYIFNYRIKELIVLIVISLTYIKSMLYGFYIGYLGIRLAVLISTLTILNKKMAIIWFIILNMPHIIFYGMAIVWVINISLDDNKNIYLFGKPISKTKNWILVCTLYFVGILLEAFINPIIISIL